ncbi:MAG: hypothetical protein ACK46X_22175, partial [Candidatus Sericytochromatia bacterium]
APQGQDLKHISDHLETETTLTGHVIHPRQRLVEGGSRRGLNVHLNFKALSLVVQKLFARGDKHHEM